MFSRLREVLAILFAIQIVLSIRVEGNNESIIYKQAQLPQNWFNITRNASTESEMECGSACSIGEDGHNCTAFLNQDPSALCQCGRVKPLRDEDPKSQSVWVNRLCSLEKPSTISLFCKLDLSNHYKKY